MRMLSHEIQSKVRDFLENAGVLFPKGKRSETDRRSNHDRRAEDDHGYLETFEADRRILSEMREPGDRRVRKTEESPLEGMM